jgi:heat shock protein HspQ
MDTRIAKFRLGQVVRHRVFAFRGVVFDVDAEFTSAEGGWLAMPEGARPDRDQPFYHLFADSGESCYTAYVSEQNLVPDDSGEPVEHPAASVMFDSFDGAAYRLSPHVRH